MVIDSHAHINSDKCEKDIDLLIADMKEDNLESLISVSYDLESSKENLQLAKKYENVYAAIGVHPIDIDYYNAEMESFILENASEKKVVAIGEIGLDYYYQKENKEEQKRVFIEQIKLAKKCNLPIIVHVRDAMADTYEILEKYAKGVGGVIHCYSGSLEMAEKFIALGFKLGFTGVITFPNNKNSEKVINGISIEDILIETDCPYMTPVPHRGKINKPKYVNFVAEKVAEMKNMSLEDVEKITVENTKRVFPKMK